MQGKALDEAGYDTILRHTSRSLCVVKGCKLFCTVVLRITAPAVVYLAEKKARHICSSNQHRIHCCTWQ